MVLAVSRRDKGKRRRVADGVRSHVVVSVCRWSRFITQQAPAFSRCGKKIMWKLYWSIDGHPYFDTQIFAALKVISVMNVSVSKRSKMNGVSGRFGEQLASIQNYW